jgi:hypothetical protein
LLFTDVSNVSSLQGNSEQFWWTVYSSTSSSSTAATVQYSKNATTSTIIQKEFSSFSQSFQFPLSPCCQADRR